MIQGIFYARFFPQKGPKIVAQSPPGCITPSGSSSSSSSTRSSATAAAVTAAAAMRPPLVDFDVLREYIIPRQAFCNCYVTVNSPDGKYTILGHPVVIPHAKYRRNQFIFNFGLIVEADADQTPYEPVVRCLASCFAELENQDEYLSQAEAQPGITHSARRSIESLLEIIKEDINNYGECMIPVDDANTINMKLFPHHPTPPLVQSWHVPVSKTKFADIVDSSWDLTLQKVVANIDGVNDVRRIAFEAGVDLDLTKAALRHLLYYETILLLDIFFFSSCYAPRPGIHDFIRNLDGMIDECAGYVSHGRARVAPYHLVKLMTAFSQGKSIKEWIKTSNDNGFDVLTHVDVRRFVQFGVIKGCIYRVHKYVVSKQYLAAIATGQSRPAPDGDPLQKYTDGNHHFDQIITEQNLTDAMIMDKLKALPVPKGDLTVMYR